MKKRMTIAVLNQKIQIGNLIQRMKALKKIKRHSKIEQIDRVCLISRILMPTHIIVICLHLHVDICLCCMLTTNSLLICVNVVV